LFEQLPQLARFGYASALARSRQQDVVRAELELTRLEDRLQVLYQQQEVARRSLGEWLSQRYAQAVSAPGTDTAAAVEEQLPALALQVPELVAAGEVANEQLATRLMRHPSVLAIEREILASGADIELSQQQYKPEWGVNVSYGYRDDDPMGAARADFLSLGVSVDLPLFTANRQDRQYQASIARAEAVKTQKWLLLRRMLSAYEVSRARLQRLTQRQQLYAQQLVPQMELQAEAALSAYTHDEGDFAEVVRSRIALVNAQIDELAIAVDRLKAIAELNYFTTAGSAHDNGTTQGEEK
jgi:outer membrane protein TolC